MIKYCNKYIAQCYLMLVGEMYLNLIFYTLFPIKTQFRPKSYFVFCPPFFFSIFYDNQMSEKY